MYKQQDAFFPYDIQHFGCYFFCLLRMCEIEADASFTTDAVLCVYNEARKRKYIVGNCSCESPDMICRIALDVLDSKKKILQVGGFSENGANAFWGWANRIPYNQYKFIALKYKTNGPIGHHYILGNAAKEIIYDPSIVDYTDGGLIGGLLHTVIG